MVVLNHNEVHHLTNEHTVSVSPVSSGVHIGQSNWILKLEGESQLQKFGLLTNICLEGDFRYPKSIDSQALQNVDCLLMNSNLLLEQEIEHNLKYASQIQNQISYPTQILQLLAKLNDLFNGSSNAKVLLPVQPTFLLELVDLLLHKLSDFIKIVVISQSAHSVVQYANINLEYLNQKLQDKIYHTENPLSFDKLLKSKRMQIFSNIQEYLNSKKTAVGFQGQKIIPNDFQRELLITSHESLRFGDVTYLFQNLNM